MSDTTSTPGETQRAGRAPRRARPRSSDRRTAEQLHRRTAQRRADARRPAVFGDAR